MEKQCSGYGVPMSAAGSEERHPWESRVPDDEPRTGVVRRLIDAVFFFVAPETFKSVQFAVLCFWILAIGGAITYAIAT